MKHQESVYTKYSTFLAEATQIVKDKISLYNSLLDPPSRNKLSGNAFQKFLYAIIIILKKAGWYFYVVIAGFLALGVFGFLGGMGSLLAINPVLAAALSSLAGGGIYLIWKNKEVYIAHSKIGKRYKTDYNVLINQYDDMNQRATHIDKLMSKCVKSICVEVFNINSDEFVSKATEDL